MPMNPRVGGRDKRRGTRALVTDRADPARGQMRRAAIVGEDRRRRAVSARRKRGAAGGELAAARRSASLLGVRAAPVERASDLSPLGELAQRPCGVSMQSSEISRQGLRAASPSGGCASPRRDSRTGTAGPDAGSSFHSLTNSARVLIGSCMKYGPVKSPYVICSKPALSA